MRFQHDPVRIVSLKNFFEESRHLLSHGFPLFWAANIAVTGEIFSDIDMGETVHFHPLTPTDKASDTDLTFNRRRLSIFQKTFFPTYFLKSVTIHLYGLLSLQKMADNAVIRVRALTRGKGFESCCLQSSS
ncbi:hypothetical protein CR157_17510 [Halomonas sp. LBP4]|nr:hypothetical protein CR157_17510 [Halomonas sp. LBP4]